MFSRNGIKRFALALFIFICTLCLAGCSSSVSVSGDSRGTAIFKVHDNNIKTELSNEDTKILADIFDGKKLYSTFSSTPSCGFSSDVSVKIGSETFCFAMDGCFTVRVGLSFFDVSKDENDIIKNILEKYGFHFPCV